MRLLVTRPKEDAAALKAKLERLGHHVILSPLLDIVPRSDVVIPLANYQFIALTSANAIRCLDRHPGLDQLRRLSLLAVGPQSAEAARHAGFDKTSEAGGDGLGLARHIIATTTPEAGPILYLSGADTASDFKVLLEQAGFSVCRIVAYEARAAASLAPGAGEAEGILLYSPRSAKIWLELARHKGIAAPRMRHYCLSANVAAVLPMGFAMQVAARPTEESLLEIIGAAA
jgi:uroporphyrinogen-III synthase